MANVVVLGAGVMGTAFTMPLADNGHQVKLVGTHLDTDIIEEIHETRVHPRLKSRVRDSVQPYTYDRLAEALRGADFVVLGVNSLGIDWAAEMLGPLLPPGLPLLFQWLRKEPTSVTGPYLASLLDVLAVLNYFVIAQFLLPT